MALSYVTVSGIVYLPICSCWAFTALVTPPISPASGSISGHAICTAGTSSLSVVWKGFQRPSGEGASNRGG